MFKICKKRNDKNKIFVNNKFKSNKSTIQCNDENEFMTLMSNDIKNKNNFLVYSDNAEKIKELYYIYTKNYANKDDYILITAERKIQIIDAQAKLKNKSSYIIHRP